ncbi:hypothetical protein NDU88_006342 [Pleurodeles waltl]|uniref:Uncharacterized protein n=1 Tax=Pleurodeles waltl TaxID=8319 RepID=A0AAV7QHM5_PLEWA|nr:hypothetical protein NDU88_006342 [Pleurodeles waltl]
MSGSQDGPRETSRDGLADPEVLSASPEGMDDAASARLFMRPHHQGEQQPEEDGITQKMDPCRLLHLGTRTTHRAEAGHAQESVATPGTGRES